MLPTVTIIGNIGYMDFAYSQDNKPRMSFNISCSEKDKNNNWMNLNIRTTVFGKTADFVNKFFNDGDVIIATGKLVEEKWTANDGTKKSKIKLLFPDISFAPKEKNENQQNNQSQQQQGYAQQGEYRGGYNGQNNQGGYNTPPAR